MRVEYEATEKRHPGHRFLDTTTYSVKRFQECCLDAAEAFRLQLKFGGEYGQDAAVHIDYAVSQGYDGDLEHNYLPISFCPFCGAKVEVVEVGRKRLEQRQVQRARTVNETVTEYVEVPLEQ